MSLQKFIAKGAHPDVLVLSDRIVVAYGQAGSQSCMLMELTRDGQEIINLTTLPLAMTQNCYPSLDYQADTLYCAYKFETGSAAFGAIWNQHGQVEEIGPIANIEHPIAVGHGWLAWVGPLKADKSKDVYRRLLSGGPATVVRNAKTSQGISHIQPDGKVLLRFVDKPWGQRDVAGPLLVTDNHDNGLLVSFAGLPGQIHLFKGEQANTPRASTDGSLYAVVTWGPPHGVRLALVSPSDLDAPIPGEPPVADIDIPNRSAESRAIAAELQLLGKGADDPERAANSGRHVEHVAYRFQQSTGVPAGAVGSWGLYKKTSGNRFRNHSVDGISYVYSPSKIAFIDIVSNSEGATAKPAWSTPIEDLSIDNYMAPLVPENVTPTPPPPPPPPPVDPDPSNFAERLVALEQSFNQLKAILRSV